MKLAITVAFTLFSAALFGLLAFAMLDGDATSAGIATVVGGVIGYVEARILRGMIARGKDQAKGRDHE